MLLWWPRLFPGLEHAQVGWMTLLALSTVGVPESDYLPSDSQVWLSPICTQPPLPQENIQFIGRVSPPLHQGCPGTVVLVGPIQALGVWSCVELYTMGLPGDSFG